MSNLEKAIETVSDMLDVVDSHGSCYVYKHNGGDARLRNVLDCLKAQQERENPKSLTLEELREMDGDPVWVTHKDGSGGRWGIVNIYPSGICADICSGTAYWFEDFIGTKAYRHKPEE